MKTLLIILCLTCFNARANAQFYYGANLGVNISKSWDGKQKKMRNGINDLYLCVPLGYASKYWVAEITPQGTLSLQASISAMIGGKLDFGDNAGLHFLVGYKDEIMYSPHPMQITHYFYPKSTLRFWTGNFMVQTSYIRKENSEIEIGIGVIGF